MRAKQGESHNSIQKLNRPLEQGTTPSLEALQNYSAGYSEMARGDFLAAVPLFERAIEIDPNFAAAYLHLGDAFNNAGDEACSRKYLQRAFSLVAGFPITNGTGSRVNTTSWSVASWIRRLTPLNRVSATIPKAVHSITD
jgi:tetratricopeptide (TPR) repeat protein